MSTHVKAAEVLFLLGAPLHLVLTVMVLHFWFTREHFEMTHVNPAWFIPAVGNVLAPISGVGLGFIETSWFFFSIGFVFWIVLLPIVVNRILFGDAPSDKFAPTVFILLAPPAVSFISYVTITGVIDTLARVLYYFALFIALFLITEVPRLARLRFTLTWWSYSFPLAAVTGASWLMYERTQSLPSIRITVGLQALLTLVIICLTVGTAIAVVRRWNYPGPGRRPPASSVERARACDRG